MRAWKETPTFRLLKTMLGGGKFFMQQMGHELRYEVAQQDVPFKTDPRSGEYNKKRPLIWHRRRYFDLIFGQSFIDFNDFFTDFDLFSTNN